MEGKGGGDEEEKEGGGGGGEAALGAASVEGESEGEESIRSQSGMWIIQGQYFKAESSRPFVFQDLNDSYPVLAPIRRPGRRRRGGDTVVIHGSQNPTLVTSGNEAEIEEDKSDEDDRSNDEEEEEREECEGSADTPVPPRFTKAVIWT